VGDGVGDGVRHMEGMCVGNWEMERIRTCDSWRVPFSRICLMTASSLWVPNSLSRVECEAPFISPCAPCL
jgi:hypothetical protein